MLEKRFVGCPVPVGWVLEAGVRFWTSVSGHRHYVPALTSCGLAVPLAWGIYNWSFCRLAQELVFTIRWAIGDLACFSLFPFLSDVLFFSPDGLNDALASAS